MESNWKSRYEKKQKLRTALRRIRIPLLTVFGALVCSFLVIPLSFGALAVNSAEHTFIDIFPSPTPQSTPFDDALAVYADSTPYESSLNESTPPPLPNKTLVPTLATAQPGDDFSSLQYGDTADKVKEIQSRLMELGYIDGDEPTSYYGHATESAVKLFQRTHYMKETGIADELFQSLLFSDSAKIYQLEAGNSGTDVTMLQDRLVELGFYTDKTNGYFGVATTRALTAFQIKNELSASGIADQDTRDLIYSPRAKPAIDPTPTPTPKPAKTPKPTNTPKPSSTPKPSTASATNAPTNTPSKTDGSFWVPDPNATPTPSPSPTIDIGVLPTDTPDVTQSPSPDLPAASGDVSEFIAVAMAQLGKPYIYSTEGPDSFDCSGLVYFSLRSVGLKVHRYSAAGFSEVSSWESIYGKSNLEPGDLIFFKNGSSTRISHTGIWLGNNSYIHASSSAGKVIVSTWSDWSSTNFVLGKRVF